MDFMDELPKAWRETGLYLKYYPRSSANGDRPFLVFVLVTTVVGVDWLVSRRYYVKADAEWGLKRFLEMLPGHIAPKKVQKLRRRLLSQIRRYKSLPHRERWGDTSTMWPRRADGTH